MDKKEIKKGDIIRCHGITLEVDKIVNQEPWQWREAYYIEFYDAKGIYRSWKQNFDGGELISK